MTMRSLWYGSGGIARWSRPASRSTTLCGGMQRRGWAAFGRRTMRRRWFGGRSMAEWAQSGKQARIEKAHYTDSTKCRLHLPNEDFCTTSEPRAILRAVNKMRRTYSFGFLATILLATLPTATAFAALSPEAGEILASLRKSSDDDRRLDEVGDAGSGSAGSGEFPPPTLPPTPPPPTPPSPPSPPSASLTVRSHGGRCAASL